MAVGDAHYKWLAAGSTVASQTLSPAASRFQFFGSYSGLSLLNVKQVVLLRAYASGADIRLLPTNDTKAPGTRIVQDQTVYMKFPPMRVSDASQLMFENLVSLDNATTRWILWQRV